MKGKRILYYDMLNIAACICVIALHQNGLVHSFSDSSAWKGALVIEVVCYWAVPIFFMLTGATLIDYRKKYNTKTFFKKRILRTMIPLFFWDLIFLIWKSWTEQIDLNGRGIKDIISMFTNNEIQNVYWFFIPLFSIYLSIPVLSMIVEATKEIKKTNKIFLYMIGIQFLLYSLLPCLFRMIGFRWNDGMQLYVGSGYLIFVLLGYVLSHNEFPKNTRVVLWILGIAGAAFRYFYTLVTSISRGEKDTLLFDYRYFPGVLLGVAVFVLFKYIPWDKFLADDRIKRIISIVSSCSLGVYMIHILVMTYMQQITGLSSNSLMWRIGFIPVVYGVRVCLKIKNCTKHMFLPPFYDKIKKKGCSLC